MRRTALALVALALALNAVAGKDFPNRPVTLTVGFAPGGASDFAARIVAKKLAENIGQPVVVENRPGAGGSVDAHHLAVAAPNGYTIALSTLGALVISPIVYKDPNFDVQRDVAPITLGMSFASLFVVNAELPVKTLGDFVALAKQEPGRLSYATQGVGTLSHLRFELFQKIAGIRIVHVPYKGGAPAMNDLLAGRVALSSATPPAALPYIEAGKLRAIAVTGTSRIPALPDVPTVAESGYRDPGLEAGDWYAFVAPARTPSDILDFWNRELTKVLKDPGVKADLARYDLDAVTSTREELARLIARGTEKWTQVVREAHITAE